MVDVVDVVDVVVVVVVVVSFCSQNDTSNFIVSKTWIICDIRCQLHDGL